MKKIIQNVILAGLFMNVVYPELLYQFNKFRFNGSLVEKFNQIDVNDLILNPGEYFNHMGEFNSL